MLRKRMRVYLDTSVFGGCFDAEFERESKALFRYARQGNLILLVSDLLLTELEPAPENIRNLVHNLDGAELERVIYSPEARLLAQEYLAAGILTDKSKVDAGHVALATVSRADAIVSWNFKHIVQLQKMKLFNQVNFTKGYGGLLRFWGSHLGGFEGLGHQV